jgi:excisionase family DNA binding protein
MSEPLTADQAAKELGYHLNYLYSLLKEGTVQGRKFGRDWMISRQEVERIKALQGPGGRLPKTARKQ